MGGGVSENGNKGDRDKRKRKQGVGGRSKQKAEGAEIDRRISGSDTLLILGDSCAPAFDPPPTGGGVVVVSRSAMLLVLSS